MKAIDKDTIRAIKKSRMRFFYICAIISLGVAFFCGMKAVSPSMIETAVNYFSQYNLSDFRLLSSYGFREEDINELASVDGVEKAVGAYSMDVIMQIGENKDVIKIMSLSENEDINEPMLIEGRLPGSYDECVIEEPARKLTGYKIGDRINVLDESHTPEELDHLKTRSFQIVGYIQTPQYISIERGNTNISDGSIDGYMMVLPESFNYERFTEAYIYTDVSAKNTNPYSDEYSSAQKEMISSLESAGQKILDDNIADIKRDAQEEIDKGENELRANENEFKNQINTAYNQIDEQSQRLKIGLVEYQNGLTTFEREISTAQNKIAEAEAQLYNGQVALENGRNQLFSEVSAAQRLLEQARAQYVSGLNAYLNGRELLNSQYISASAQLEQGWTELNEGYRLYSENLSTFNAEINSAQEELQAGKAQLEEGLREYDRAKEEVDNEFLPAETSLKEGYEAYERALNEYESSLNTFNEEIEEAQSQIDEGREELKTGEETYESNYALYEESLKTFNENKENFEALLPSLESALEQKRNSLEEVESNLTTLNEEISPLEEEKTKLTGELEDYKTQIKNKEDSIAKIDEELTSTKESLEEIEKQLEETPDSEDLIAERDRLKSRISELEEEKTSENTSLESLKTEETNTQSSLDEVEKTLSPLYESQRTLTEKKNTLSGEITESETYINTTKESLEEKERELNEIGNTLTATREKLDTFKQQLDTSQEQLDQKRMEGEAAFEAAQLKLDETYSALQNSEKELDQKRKEADEQLKIAFEPILKAQEELENAEKLLLLKKNEGLIQLNSALYELTVAREELVAGESALKTEIAKAESELNSAQDELTKADNQIRTGYLELELQSRQGLAQLNEAQATLLAGESQLNDSKALFFSQRESGLRELDNAYRTLKDGEKKLEEGETELKKREKEGQEKIDEGWKRINDSRRELANLSRGEWYVYSRDDNPGYSGYQQDAERIDNVANIFPLFFFLVAALVAFTTMTRMVEEERTQIGTLYALGYTRGQILKKYVIYAGLGALIGATIGWILGVFTLPLLIFWAYNILYQMPDMILSIPWHIVIISYLISFICTIGAAVVVALSELRSAPAELMRPKAPKPGKRIFLERIPFIWNRLGFITKVSMRNIFRYKARFLMTVVGIAGCTALILAGFGLHDAIFTIVPSQFGVINHYDQSLIIKDTSTDLDAKLEKVVKDTRVSDAMPVDQETISVITSNGNLDAYLIVPREPDRLSNFISLHERTKRDVPIELTEDGIVVSEKLATNYNAKPGEIIELEIDNKKYKAKVSAQTENYLENYVYMSPALYQRIVGKAPEYSVIYVNFTEDLKDTTSQDAFASDMIATGDYSSAINVATMVDTSNKTMQSLNILVIVMIVSAGALAFIVLNNLTNINISERVREIATLKVLGFRSKETNNYIFRENIILSLFGIALGLVLGIILLRFIIATVELDIIMFGREIHPLSYLYSIVLTLGFTIIVNYTMIPVIKRIDMVEALKDID